MKPLYRQFSLFGKLFYARFYQNRLPQAAGYLTYSTMLALVPLVMVVFSIFSAFPVFNEVTDEIKRVVFANFVPSTGDVVGEYLDQFVKNSKQMSAIGIISLILVALLLINSIDRTINSIWQGNYHRPLLYSFSVYWLILTFGPMMIAASIGVSAYVGMMAEQFLTTSYNVTFIWLLDCVPFILTWSIFTLIYTIVPNKKVSVKHSAAGALVATVFFTLGKQAFTWYIVHFPSYQLIYGAMATLPIMLLWIHISWLFILLGAQLAAVLSELQSNSFLERNDDCINSTGSSGES